MKKKKCKITISSLNTQVFFFVIFPISLLLIIITIGSMKIHQNAMRDLVGERDLRTVRGTAKALSKQLDHHSIAIQSLHYSLTDKTVDLRTIEISQILLNNFDVGVALYTEKGELLDFLGNEEIFFEISNEIKVQIDNLDQNQSNKLNLSDSFQNENMSEYYAFSYFKSDESSIFTIGIFSITNLARDIFSGLSSSLAQDSFILVDQNKNILFSNGNINPLIETEEIPGVAEALREESGTTFYSIDDGEHVVAFSPVELTEWALVIDEAWDSVASPILKYSESASLVLVPIVIISIYGFWLTSKKIIQPLNALQKQAAEFSDGKKTAFSESVGGIDEIQSLQTEFYTLTNKVHDAQDSLRNYLGMITSGQEEERNRLARELHDETLQSLIALNQRIMLLKRHSLDNQTNESINEIEMMISDSMRELRRFTKALRPIYLEELGLVAAIESQIIETNQNNSVQIKFQCSGKEIRLSDKIEIALYRITQEAINNLLKHAKASEAKVLIDFSSSNVHLSIIDNGTGFILPRRLSDLSNKNHFGILGIYERAELIGANIKISSGDSGTNLSLNVSV